MKKRFPAAIAMVLPALKKGKPTRFKLKVLFTFPTPSKDKVFVSHVDPVAGYDVWIDQPERVIASNNLSVKPKPLKWQRPPHPEALANSGRTVDVKIRVLISPHGSIHNPVLVESEAPELYLDAAIYLASLKFEPGIDESGKTCWSRQERNVRFAPPAGG